MDSTVLDAGIAAQQLQLVNAIVDEDRQYATRLTITRTDNENASESVISTVISWLMKKKVLSKEHCDSFREGTYSTPDGWNGTTELEQGKTALASKRNSGVPGCAVWAMELDEQDHRLIYGRWHTRIGIIGNADSCIVNIQLSRYIVRGFIGEAAPPIPSTPRIVKMLFSDEANVVRVGSTFLNDKPIYLTSETLTSKFIPDLTDPNRTLSLILIATDEESKLPVRNLKNLTKQLFGMADIYVLDWHDRALMDTYREVFLKNTPAYDYGTECSSLKIYCKPVDLTVPADNEMGMAYAKYLIDRYTRHGENRFINVLRQGICRASDRVAGDILSIADVRWLDGIDEAKRLSSRIKKLKQRVKGDSGGNETIDSLRDEISGLQKDIADWEEIASELETSNLEAAAKIDMLTRDAMRLENEKRAVERKGDVDLPFFMSIYCRFRSAIQTAGAVCIENFSPGSILVEDEIDDLGNIPASDLILGKYEIHRLNFTVAIIDIDDERSLFLFHFRNLAIRDGAAGKLEMNVIVASFPAGSGKGSRLAL